jgi:hypothetical protein
VTEIPEPTNGWSRFERVIVYRLDTLDKDLGQLEDKFDRRLSETNAIIRGLRDEEIGKLKVEVAMLKVKSSLWGAAAGFLPAALIAVYFLLGH